MQFKNKASMTTMMIALGLSTSLISCGSSKNSETVAEKVPVVETPVVTPPIEEKPTTDNKGAFIEENGVIVIEMESTNYSGNWKLVSDSAAFGGQAIEWTGDDLFSSPGTDVIEIKVLITNTGIYQFAWANQIGEGNSTTEANDSWLKIKSTKFYGDNGTTIVCPKGQDTSKNSCIGEEPEGAGKLGWFKVYRSGGDVTQFIWKTSTSDKDPHNIYAEFTQAGTYTIQVSGRSKHHIIDRLILVKDSTMFESAKNQDESVRIPTE